MRKVFKLFIDSYIQIDPGYKPVWKQNYCSAMNI